MWHYSQVCDCFDQHHTMHIFIDFSGKGDLEFAQQLIENGADVNAVMTVNITGITIQAFTPLQRLLANPFSPTRKVVELLIEYGADVNAVPLDDVSNSPLHLAIEKERGNYSRRIVISLVTAMWAHSSVRIQFSCSYIGNVIPNNYKTVQEPNKAAEEEEHIFVFNTQ